VPVTGDLPRLRPASALRPEALAILAAERRRLAALLPPEPPYELVLTGGSSLDGALTKGDVDLHLRVDPASFDAVSAILRSVYEVVLPEIWQPGSLATFAVPGAPLPTGVALTPVGSVHDGRFRRSWELLAADPELLAAYNALKLASADYEAAKSEFFDRLLDSPG
jgi:hypothetical protein